MAPTDVMLTFSKVSWTPLATGLNYNVTVCNASHCPIQMNCTEDCTYIQITGIEEGVKYTVTVCSFKVINGLLCGKGMTDTCYSTSAGA